MRKETRDYYKEVKGNFTLKTLFIGIAIWLILALLLLGKFSCEPATPATTEKHKQSIDTSYLKLSELEKINSQKDAEILELQNQLHKVSVNFQNYKKTPIYKDRIRTIIETIPIDTLASNRIELEVCKTENSTKDTIIQKYALKSNILQLQEIEYKSIIEEQNEVIEIHLKEIMQEQKLTKKEKLKKNVWKLATGVVTGLLIFDKIK